MDNPTVDDSGNVAGEPEAVVSETLEATSFVDQSKLYETSSEQADLLEETMHEKSSEYLVPPSLEPEDEWEECEDDDEPVIVWWWRWRRLIVLVVIILIGGFLYLLHKYKQSIEESNVEVETVSEKEQYANGSVADAETSVSKESSINRGVIIGNEEIKRDAIIDNEETTVTKRNVAKVSEEKIDTSQLEKVNVVKNEKDESKTLFEETAVDEVKPVIKQQQQTLPVEITITEPKDYEIEFENSKLNERVVNQQEIAESRGEAVEDEEHKVFTPTEQIFEKFDETGRKISEIIDSRPATDVESGQLNEKKIDREFKSDKKDELILNATNLETQNKIVDTKQKKYEEHLSSEEETSESLSLDDKKQVHAVIVETTSKGDDKNRKEPAGVNATESEEILQDNFQPVLPGSQEPNALTDSTITIIANQNVDDSLETFISQKGSGIVDQYDHDEYSSSEEYSNRVIEEQNKTAEAITDDAHKQAETLSDLTDEKSKSLLEDEINITFSLKNAELLKSQGLHNAAVEGEVVSPHGVPDEVFQNDLVKHDAELYDENDTSFLGQDSKEVEIVHESGKDEEVEEIEEVSEEFGENTTAPEIESYEALVEAETEELSEKEVEDVEFEENLDDFDQLEKEKGLIIETQFNEDNVHAEESPNDLLAQKPSFISSKEATDNVPKDVYANGSPEDDYEDGYGVQNSVLEVIGANNIEEMLMKMDTLEAVAEVMRMAGLESSNLIFGIDYTASNKYQGENCFGGKSLHTVEPGILNPYQQVITILGKTLAPFASSGFIAAYGFGDVKSSDESVFPLKPIDFCQSFEDVLNIYNQVTPKIILSGPTNFAPLIYQAMEITKQVKDYHILVIVADGQVTNERATRRAIVDACKYPISIVVVGVGDGPWDMMRVFDDSLPKRPWDNFHFVEFHQITSKVDNPDLAFAVQSLLEIPDQYKKIKAMGLLNFPDSD